MRKLLTFLLLQVYFSGFSQATLLKDINSGAPSSNPASFTNVNGTLYFSASDGKSGRELYKSNNTTSGTRILKDIFPGGGSSSPGNLTNFGGKLIFSASTPSEGAELWISDGTTAGTTLLKDIVPGAASSSPYQFKVIGSTLYFFTFDSDYIINLWKTDGTTSGTLPVRKLPELYVIKDVAELNGELFFTSENELWKSNGTLLGTNVIKSLEGSIDYLTSFKGKLYFGAGAGPQKLWVSNGTTAGTIVLSTVEIWFPEFTPLGNYLYFIGDSPKGGRELWKTNGTTAGTTLVKDINTQGAGFTHYYKNGMIASGNLIYFTAINSRGERTLYKSNGSASGTTRIESAPTFSPEENVVVESTSSTVYFTQGKSLWKSDGTEAGTVLIRTFTQPVSNMGRVYSILYFNGTTSLSGTEPWKYTPPTSQLADPSNKKFKPLASNRIVTIFPNTFKNSTHLKISEQGLTQPLSVKILNFNGKLLSSFIVKQEKDVEFGAELPSGMYVLQLTSGVEKYSKIIVKE